MYPALFSIKLQAKEILFGYCCKRIKQGISDAHRIAGRKLLLDFRSWTKRRGEDAVLINFSTAGAATASLG
jgi:hypothetical protein